MKVKLRYDGQLQELEVPEEDFAPMIEKDYQERLEKAIAAGKDPASVRRRKPQEILNEEFNVPEYRNYRKYQRHNVSLNALHVSGKLMNQSVDLNLLESCTENATVFDLMQALDALSETQRRRLLLLAEGYSINQIAALEHADPTSVYESILAARKKIVNLL